MPKEEQHENAGKWFDWIPQGLKFGPGVIGKNAMILVASMVPLAIAAWKLPSEWWAVLGFVVLIMVYVLVNQRQNIKYAEKNPGPSVLEGAHFVSFQRIIEQAKGKPETLNSPLMPDPMLSIPPVSPSALLEKKPDREEGPPKEVKL